jgi:hypothetical protein
MKVTALLLVLAALLVAGAVLAANGLAIPRQLIGGGGGLVQDGIFALHGSIGQTVAGGVGNGSYGIRSGFWQEQLRRHQLYLPLIVKGSSYRR